LTISQENIKILSESNEKLNKLEYQCVDRINYTSLISKIKSDNNKFDSISIIGPYKILSFLQLLYSELHKKLIDIASDFTNYRRKYFGLDHHLYMSIINNFLISKDELYLSILSKILRELNIKEKELDNSLSFYLNQTSDDKLVDKIVKSYNKVLHSSFT